MARRLSRLTGFDDLKVRRPRLQAAISVLEQGSSAPVSVPQGPVAVAALFSVRGKDVVMQRSQA